jgi:hypothetical protein
MSPSEYKRIQKNNDGALYHLFNVTLRPEVFDTEEEAFKFAKQLLETKWYKDMGEFVDFVIVMENEEE